MKPEDAFALIQQATLSVQADGHVHAKLRMAISVIQKVLIDVGSNGKPVEEESTDDLGEDE